MGLGAFAFFPFGTAIFALFGGKSQVFPATFRLLFGELPATKRRRGCRPFVTSSPFRRLLRPLGLFLPIYARRGFCPHFATLLCESSRPPQLHHFAVRKSPPPTSPLCSAKVPGRLDFATSPCESHLVAPDFATSPCESRLVAPDFATSPWENPKGGSRSPGSPWKRPRPNCSEKSDNKRPPGSAYENAIFARLIGTEFTIMSRIEAKMNENDAVKVSQTVA